MGNHNLRVMFFEFADNVTTQL